MIGVAGPAVLGSTAEAATAEITVLTNATVIDGTGVPARHNVTLVLVGDRIAWIGHAPPPSEGARVIDLRGKYVIPGLWDMHTHFGFDDKITVPLHIVNGVTGVREMWGFPEIRAVRDRIERGELLGPRFIIASSIIDGANSVWARDSTQVVTAEEARAAVRTAKADGADFIKIYTYLGREAFLALADEARRVGLAVAGHHPARLRVRDVTDAGMRSFEHLYSLPIATSSRESEIQRLLDTTPVDPANPRGYYNYVRELDRQAALAHDPGKADALFARFVRNGTWQSPTLTVLRAIALPADTFTHDPRLKYIDRPTQEFWASHIKEFAPKTPEEVARQREFLRFRFELVSRMERAGVRLIGGTDTPNPYVFPGFAVHDELSLLVQAGLSPLRALQTVTRDAACFLGLEPTMGTVSPGKVADLLVLDANPLADITNTQKIHAIVARGKLITAEQRAAILAEVEAAAAATAPAAVVTEAHGLTCACHN